MKYIDINCDVGEGIDNEEFIMPFIQSCSIACGGHSGDSESMKKVVQLALKYQVKIGAHPSYPDKINFGRKSMRMGRDELIESVQTQIENLMQIIDSQGAQLNHIKPHGALYNDIASNQSLARIFLEAVLPYKHKAVLYVPYNSGIERESLIQGFSIVHEAFADRAYSDDLSLVSREQKEALITNIEQVYRQVSEIFYSNKVLSISNKSLYLKADTYCVHSDTQNALEIVKFLYHKLVKKIEFEDL